MVEFPECLGCSVKHASSARTLLVECIGFKERGDDRMARLHCFYAIGELREAEKQMPQLLTELKARLTDLRKRIEQSIALGRVPPHELFHELDRVGVESIERLEREAATLCPTCIIDRKPKVEHI